MRLGSATRALPPAAMVVAALLMTMADAAAGSAAAPVATLSGIAPALARCWQPPHEGDEITVRLGFRRDGTLLGKPRMTYLKAAGGADGEAALANSLLQAVQACTPMRFTTSMGEAIAGRVLTIRLVAHRRERTAGGVTPGDRA